MSERSLSPRKAEVLRLAEAAAPLRRDWLARNGFFHDEDLLFLKFLIPEGQRILELGCGTGHLLARLAPSRGVGVDISQGMIAEARKTYPDLDFVVGDADDPETLARIAVKNHANALHNPLAHFRKAFDFEACNTVSDRNPMIAPPLRLTDCSPISDGAAAVVMVAEDMVADFPRAVGFRAAVHMNDFLPLKGRDLTRLEAASRAFAMAFETAGIGLDDLDLAEVHDCFTIAELMICEAMGLAPLGQGAGLIAEGATERGGRLPVNVSGGLKAKGHPVGATGVSMHITCAKHLTGSAPVEEQIAGATLAAAYNMGGSGVANYCSILEPVK